MADNPRKGRGRKAAPGAPPPDAPEELAEPRRFHADAADTADAVPGTAPAAAGAPTGSKEESREEIFLTGELDGGDDDGFGGTSEPRDGGIPQPFEVTFPNQEEDRLADAAEKLGTSAQNIELSTRQLVRATHRVAQVILDQPALRTTERQVSLSRTELEDTGMEPLWHAIAVHSDALSFESYRNFIERVLCGGGAAAPDEGADPREVPPAGNFRAQLDRLRRLCHLPGVDAYELLRTATETFLLLQCGVCPPEAPGDVPLIPVRPPVRNGVLDPNAELPPGTVRFGRDRTLTFAELTTTLQEFLGHERNNYIQTVIRGAFSGGEAVVDPFCAATAGLNFPCLLELIWSYWMEEGMLTQTIAVVTRRFQNVRAPGRRPDPLVEFELDPLRPLNGFLWGFLQDEPNRLTLMRRAYEYNHHYGLTLYGRAVASMRPADPRSRFLEAFHNLLRQAAEFYRQDNDTTVIADAFPVLNSLKDAHLVLSEGAHNQFRDLPWTARSEMLLQQWMLSRPEMREFLRGRYMVAYPEAWMGAVDSMKRLQGWSQASVIHFRDLAVFGERILLSIRYGNWSATSNQDHARAWLRYWKQEIQGYIHAYHTVTGVNLSDDAVEVRDRSDIRYLQPSFHLRNRLLEQRREQRRLMR